MPVRDDLIVGRKMKPVLMQLQCIACHKSLVVHAAAFDPPFDGFVVAGSCAPCAQAHKEKRKAQAHVEAPRH